MGTVAWRVDACGTSGVLFVAFTGLPVNNVARIAVVKKILIHAFARGEG
jgi:hypothetical protein